jgi:hypothetical protein
LAKSAVKNPAQPRATGSEQGFKPADQPTSSSDREKSATGDSDMEGDEETTLTTGQKVPRNPTWNETQGLARGWGSKKDQLKRKRKNNGKGREPTTRIPDQWKRGATLEEITATFYDKTILPSGGANSGVPGTLLWAGRGCGDSRDVDAATVNNSNDPDAWTKLGHLKVGECNEETWLSG